MKAQIKARIGQEEERPFLGLALSQLIGIGISLLAGIFFYMLFFFLPIILRSLLGVAALSATLFVAFSKFHGISGPQYLWISFKYRRKPKLYLYQPKRICKLTEDGRDKY